MKQLFYLFVLSIFLFSACKMDREKVVQKKWKTVDIQYLSMEKAHEQYKQIIDTMTDKNVMLLDFKTVDSSKKFLQFLMDSDSERKKLDIENTFLELRPDKKALFTSIDGTDSSSWSIEEDDIVLEDERITGVANSTRMHIESLSEKAMTLRLVMMGDTSYIKLIPYKD